MKTLLQIILPLLLPMGCRNWTQYHSVGPSNSLFGYALTFHTESNHTRYIVGAPKSNTVQLRYGIRHPGAIYSCDLHPHSKCKQVTIDKFGNTFDKGLKMEEKSHQWFGTSVTSSGDDGLMACASRYVFYSVNSKRKEPVGTCFIAKKQFSTISEVSPCRTRLWGYHKEGFCQAGMSSAASEEAFFIGGVGTTYWQGQVFSKFHNGSFYKYWGGMSTEQDDNQYLGYALKTGHFFVLKNETAQIVASAPRAVRLLGKVYIISTAEPHGRILYTFTGEQTGAYFGHALDVGDFNGDGLDDILVGAPLFSGPRSSSYEVGRAYVLFREEKGLFKHWRILDGDAPQGRFGFALANLGDITGDGIDDFCVSAPFAEANQGLVKVYAGCSDTDDSFDPIKVLRPLAFPRPVQSFGFALSGNPDRDAEDEEEEEEDNTTAPRPVIVVGAPLSDMTFVVLH